MIFINNKKTVCALILAILLLLSGSLNAAGLLTPFTECKVEDAVPGESYVLKSVSGHPLKIKNTSQDEISVKISIEKPPAETLKDNYKGIPDISWITINKEIIEIVPDSWGEAELKLNIPRRKEYYGKNYQASVSVRTVGKKGTGEGGNLSVGLRSRIYIRTREKEGFMRKIFGWLFGNEGK